MRVPQAIVGQSVEFRGNLLSGGEVFSVSKLANLVKVHIRVQNSCDHFTPRKVNRKVILSTRAIALSLLRVFVGDIGHFQRKQEVA